MGDNIIFRLVQKSYPTCTIIDSTKEDEGFICDRCDQRPVEKVYRVKDDGNYEVTLCTGRFNVYVLNITKEQDVK